MEDPEVEILRDKLAKAMAEYKRNIKINEEKDVTIRRLFECSQSMCGKDTVRMYEFTCV